MNKPVCFTNLKRECGTNTYKVIGVVLLRERDILRIEEKRGIVSGKERPLSRVFTYKNFYYVKETPRVIIKRLSLYGNENGY